MTGKQWTKMATNGDWTLARESQRSMFGSTTSCGFPNIILGNPAGSWKLHPCGTEVLATNSCSREGRARWFGTSSLRTLAYDGWSYWAANVLASPRNEDSPAFNPDDESIDSAPHGNKQPCDVHWNGMITNTFFDGTAMKSTWPEYESATCFRQLHGDCYDARLAFGVSCSARMNFLGGNQTTKRINFLTPAVELHCLISLMIYFAVKTKTWKEVKKAKIIFSY